MCIRDRRAYIGLHHLFLFIDLLADNLLLADVILKLISESGPNLFGAAEFDYKMCIRDSLTA